MWSRQREQWKRWSTRPDHQQNETAAALKNAEKVMAEKVMTAS